MDEDLNELIRKAQFYLGSNQLKPAVDALQKAIKIDPNFVNAWLLLGNIFFATQQYNHAIEALETAVDINPNLPSQIWNNLGHMYIQIEQYDQAFEPVKKALKVDPKNTSAWDSLGLAFLGKEDYKQAIESFQKAVELDSNRFDAWNHLGSALDDNKQYKQAIKAFKKALELDPSSNTAWIGIAMTYVNDGNYKKAIDAYEKSLKIDPDNAVAWFRLGTTLSEAGKLNKGIKSIKTGLKIEPNIVQGWMDLQRIAQMKGDKELEEEALKGAHATGKVDVKFVDGDGPIEEVEKTVKETIDEWSSKQNLIEKRLFSSWALMIPKDFSEDWDGNKLQLISPDDKRCITTNALTLETNIPAEKILPPAEEFMRMGGKLHSNIKKGKLRGYIIENKMHDVFIIQCSIAGPSRLLMLTFTISNTKEEKEWALQVIDSVKLYQS